MVWQAFNGKAGGLVGSQVVAWMFFCNIKTLHPTYSLTKSRPVATRAGRLEIRRDRCRPDIRSARTCCEPLKPTLMAVEQTRQSPFTAFRLKLGVSKADLMKAWEGGE
eukprot:3178161-Prymnesium_polylepis.1